MPTSELLLRLIIAFITLLILTRIIGRKEISQMTFFNFISGISIGTIGASLAINSSVTISNGIIALITWSIFTILLGFVDIKSKKARIVVEGEPLIVVKEGKIMESKMRRARLDVDALKALLRQKNIFSMTDVDYAIFETDGKLSVLRKEPVQPVTKSDMNIPKSTVNLSIIPTGVISDGKVVKENLEKLKISRQWVEQQIQAAGIQSVADVFYAEIQPDGTLYIDKRSDM